MTNLRFLFSLALVTVNVAFEFNATSPLPSRIMSRFANTTKPILHLPHVTEYFGYATVLVPVTIQMAIENLANVTPHLEKFELSVEFYEGFCTDANVVMESIELMENGKNPEILPFHMTSGCSSGGQRVVGEIAHVYNFISIATLDAVTESFDDRSRFQNMFTLGESVTWIQEALSVFMKAQGWKRMAILGEDHTFYINVSHFIFVYFFYCSNLFFTDSGVA